MVDKNYCLKCKNESNYDTCVSCYAKTVDGVPLHFIQMERSVKKPEDQPKSDPVNHPSHYATGKYECIEVMKEIYGVEATQEFCLLNAFKYLWRCKHKKNKVEDIDKANYYLNEFLKMEDEKHGKS